MNIVLSGGGTAGHINPALALAEELQSRGHAVFFAGTPSGVEARLVPQAGVSFTAFEASGFNRRHPLSLIRALRLMAASTKKAKEWFGEIKPAAAVCFGGYVSIPVGRAAMAQNIPLIIHEQNSVMGMANKYLSKKAARVALTYDAAGSAVADKSKLVLTGNPVRKSMFETSRADGRAYCGVPEDATMLLIFGGKSYEFRRMIVQGRTERNAPKVMAKMDALLEAEDFLAFSAFCDENYVDCFDNAFEKYAPAERASAAFSYVYRDLMSLVAPAEYAQPEDLAAALADNLDYFYDVADIADYEYYDGADSAQNRAALAAMKERVELLLITYCGLSAEEAEAMETMSVARRAIILEEAALDE